MKWSKAIIFTACLALIFVLLNFSYNTFPPFGPLLNPFSGYWQNGTQSDKIEKTIRVKGLRDSVSIYYDNRRVPHLFAGNLHDLAFTQGFLSAKNRLWQMDFQYRAAAGKLSEILGKKTLNYDRFRRRIGMDYAAENALRGMQADSLTGMLVSAYAAGVNAWIGRLKAADLPLEFKILNYFPERWTPLKTAYIFKLMAWDLTGRNYELPMERTRKALGDEQMNRLFPLSAPFLHPVIPRGTIFRFKPLPAPPVPRKFFSVDTSGDLGSISPPGYLKGSNNWAVSGRKTRSGYPILASDPHLGLNLPSVWYELQLAAPGINVYGVATPGIPLITIGFNNSVAWGLTNAGSDVFDWYRETFRDSSRSEVLFAGRWEKTRKRVEVIKVRGQADVIDTVIYTRHGPIPTLKGEKPVMGNSPVNAAMRWTPHDSSNELRAFLLLNMAKNYGNFREALKFFDSPALNFVYADNRNNIAIWHNGKFPLRWRQQGRYPSDGSDPDYEWHGWIPRDQLPHIKNPDRGFVSSANQPPTDSTYPYYLGWYYEKFERSARINEVLRQAEDITPEDMMALQLDNVNLIARMGLPVLLAALDSSALTPAGQFSRRKLENWDYHMARNELAPSIFSSWWYYLNLFTWSDELKNLFRPSRAMTLKLLLEDPDSPCFDNKSTPKREVMKDIARQAFQVAVKKLLNDFGPPGKNWKWRNYKQTNIVHLGRIPGLGEYHLATDGAAGIVNAISRTHGPSWRMVVQLGKTPRAWGVFPGGESGNPGSKYYKTGLEMWRTGKWFPLIYMRTPKNISGGIVAKTILSGE